MKKGATMPLYMDKAMPEIWKASQKYTEVVRDVSLRSGITEQESELIKMRVSQINACGFCLDLHYWQARKAGVSPQLLAMLPAWRESSLFGEREKALLAVAEAATNMPISEESRADLAGARSVLGDETLAAAEWIAVTINLFNRVSILSGHPVRPRDENGAVIRR